MIYVLGENTLPIMALHFLSFKIVNLLLVIIYSLDFNFISSFPIIEDFSYMWWGYSLFGLFIPIIFTRMYKLLLGYLKKIFFTERNFLWRGLF